MSARTVGVSGEYGSRRLPNDPSQFGLPQLKRGSLLGPELVLVVNRVGDASSAVNVVEQARADVRRNPEAGKVGAYGASQVMHRGVGNAETERQARHGSCDCMGIDCASHRALAGKNERRFAVGNSGHEDIGSQPRVINTQAMRAILFAIATAAILVVRRCRSLISQGRFVP